MIRDSRGCREFNWETVDGRPWVSESWTIGTEEEPVVDLRVGGTDEDEGMNLSSFDFT